MPAPLYQHPAFPQPDDPHTPIWRYMDWWKFASTLEYGRLYMPTVAEFKDDLEGTVPAANAAWWDAQIAAAPSPEHQAVLVSNRDKLAGFAVLFRKICYISCWRMDDREDPTAWETYTSGPPAVAIRTTCSKLRGAMAGYVEMGRVTYIDYINDSFPPMGNMYLYLMHKDASRFQAEKEYRAIALPPHESNKIAHGDFVANFFEHPETGARIYAPKINFSNLVDSVVLHPDITLADAAAVTDLCAKHGLPVPMPSSRYSTG